MSNKIISNNLSSDEDCNIPTKLKRNINATQKREIPHHEETVQIPLPILSSVCNFFNFETTKSLEDLSDEENVPIETKRRKKKSKEIDKAQEAKSKEEYLYNIERERLNGVKNPENADQFERILLAEPNSSVLWIKYLSFYLAIAEFDKARAVGKRALETINVALEDEKMNVWISMLNLELYYGTKESFEKLLEEAMKYNDVYKVYVKVLDMLHEAGKVQELEEKIKKALSKFKQEPDIWVHVTKLYYLLGKFDEARNTRNKCLKCINNRKQQYSLIIKFAILEFNHGEIDVGSSIFEIAIEEHPNKIGVWLVYIDQLIGKNLIDEARSIFDRAITLKFPIKTMKVIYHKYRSFEEKYGTPQTKELFIERAKKIL